jgi:hypothetical protein
MRQLWILTARSRKRVCTERLFAEGSYDKIPNIPRFQHVGKRYYLHDLALSHPFDTLSGEAILGLTAVPDWLDIWSANCPITSTVRVLFYLEESTMGTYKFLALR